MARHGSLEFQPFAKQYQFQHVTSSPRFPQSNGLVERTVQIAKKLLKKAYEDNKDPYLAILELAFHQRSCSWGAAQEVPFLLRIPC